MLLLLLLQLLLLLLMLLLLPLQQQLPSHTSSGLAGRGGTSIGRETANFFAPR
jgi:hypothetical protein